MPYSWPTMAEMFGLNMPLPTMIVARPSLKMSGLGMVMANRPATMNDAPTRIERW